MKVAPICLLCILSVFAQLSRAQSGTPSVPGANPGRPTVSTPATLTPVGYLQFENGALFAEDSAEFSKRIGIGQVTKLSVLPRLELFLQSKPLAISQSKERTAVHEGEVFASVQSVLFVGDESRPTVSISYVRRVHTSVAPELDVGTFRQSTSILMSEDLHGFHFDTNGILAEQVQGAVLTIFISPSLTWNGRANFTRSCLSRLASTCPTSSINCTVSRSIAIRVSGLRMAKSPKIFTSHSQPRARTLSGPATRRR